MPPDTMLADIANDKKGFRNNHGKAIKFQDAKMHICLLA